MTHAAGRMLLAQREEKRRGKRDGKGGEGDRTSLYPIPSVSMLTVAMSRRGL